MDRKTVVNSVRVAMVTGIFAVGFLCGSVTHRSANADMSELGGELLNRAAGSGGIIGTAAQLGVAITDMEKQVNGLQKNLTVLKKIKTTLGG